MSKTITIRIERTLIDEAKDKCPELKEISDTDVVRVVIRKFLEEKK